MGVMMAGGPSGSGLWRSLRYFGESLQFGGVLCPQSLFIQKEEAFGGERRKQKIDTRREKRAGQERVRLRKESQERNVCSKVVTESERRPKEEAARVSDFWPVLGENFLHSSLRLTCAVCTRTQPLRSRKGDRSQRNSMCLTTCCCLHK